MSDRKKIELLAPAGDLEKLKIAVTYGADAVYMGGKALGLRAKAKNFDFTEIEDAISFAHQQGTKVYITANIFAHNEDLIGAADYFKRLQALGADALIISDPGIFSIARKAVPDMEIHISTQANNTNYASALFWRDLGAKRIVLARELSIGEIGHIHRTLEENGGGLELEAFVHGAMCISYSGRCLLSNYMAGRDANKGECAHPCRWQYSLMEEKRPGEYMPVYEDERGTYIYNSKDLCMIGHVPDLIGAGVTSLKIEGRMKTSYYVAAVTKAYRQAIDDYMKDPALYEQNTGAYMEALKKASHRDYTTAFYYGKPGGEEQIYTNNSYIRHYDFIGLILDYDYASGTALIEQRNKFSVGDSVEVFRADGGCFTQEITSMTDEDGNPLMTAPHPKQRIKIKLKSEAAPFDMLRKKSEI